MTWAVVAVALFFAIVAIWKFDSIESRLNQPSTEPPSVSWSGAQQPRTFDEQLKLARMQAAYALEREALARRYNQAGIAIASRLWTRFMGFVTGMVLALVGAAFVLGRLESDKNEFEAGAKGLSFALRSASPGVMLAMLGTVLMALSIAITSTATTSEKAVYFTSPSESLEDDPAPSTPPPIDSAAPSQPQPQRRQPN